MIRTGPREKYLLRTKNGSRVDPRGAKARNLHLRLLVMQINHRAVPPQITGSISEVLRANRWATLANPSLQPTLNRPSLWLWSFVPPLWFDPLLLGVLPGLAEFLIAD